MRRGFYFVLFLLSVVAQAREVFLPLEQYVRLTGTQRREYVQQARAFWVDFEKTQSAGSDYFASLKLFSEAHATGSGECAVGGIFRALVNGKCPTGGRECPGRPGTFRCGKLYGEVCVSREPVGNLSERCSSSAGPDISADNYARVAPVIERNLQLSCSGASSQRRACQLLSERFEKLNRKYASPSPPQPRPPTPTPLPPEPTPKPVENDKFSTVKQGVCREERDQGQLGTCHAFCLTCVYDNAMSKANGDNKFKSSANWIAMLSVVERMCDDPASLDVMSDELLMKGWHSNKNLTNLAAYGACAEEDFHPYEGQANWAGGLKSASRGVAVTKGLNPEPIFEADESAKWKSRFGIGPHDAYQLFCPGRQDMAQTAGGYPARLQDLKARGKLSPKFAKCAEEALKNKEKLSPGGDKECKNKFFAGSTNVVGDLKKLLHEAGGPVPVAIKTNVNGHGYHCVTVTGYDDATQKFTTVNSWGTRGEYRSIDYAQANEQVLQSVEASCPIVGGHTAASGEGTSFRPKTAK